MKRALIVLGFSAFALTARAQIQVDLKLPRLQYIAYEPVVVTVGITNLAGRDVELRDTGDQPWFGFEVTGSEAQPITPNKSRNPEPSLRIEAGKRVTRKIDVGKWFAVQEFGAYHVRAHIFFPDLNKFFYSQAKVFEVTDGRPIWQRTVGMPDDSGPGNVRTYSLLTNRFPDHTSLYVRVADKDNGIVYATYSLGHIIAFDAPQAELDRENQLHVLHCAAPRTWSYSRVSLNGQRVSHSTFMETRTRPRLVRTDEGAVAVRGGMVENPLPAGTPVNAPKLSDRPADE